MSQPALSTDACGTTTGYSRGCRCEECREAVREYQRRFRAGRRIKKGRPFRPIRHGTANAYVKRKCRCRECRLYWREYTREQARRLRGYQHPGTSHSICVVCEKSFPAAGRNLYCSPACGAKAWRDKRRQRKSFTAPLPLDMQERWKQQRANEVASAMKANAELAALIAEQERDAKVGGYVSHRMQSLDAQVVEDGNERYELVGSDELDPSAICIQEESAKLINEVIGNRTEEDIRRLDYHTQEYLAGKLRDAGLAAVPVMRSERKRLMDPVTHSGIKVDRAGGHGGKEKRREKVQANRHSRPSQKPPKRWKRTDWLYEVMA